MRPQVVLDKASGDIWPKSFKLAAQKTSTKLSPVLEVLGTGESQIAVLSCHCSFLAAVTHGENASNRLYVINLIERRFYLLKRIVEPCTALAFHPYQEHTLFLATASCKVYSINVDDGTVTVMEGHKIPVEGIQSGARSPVVMTYNAKEVLLWSWPSLTLSSRLLHDDRVAVVWAGHVWQRNELVVSFITGSVLIWLSHKQNIQVHIEPPMGIDFDFKAFALSRGGEWLVGGGKSHLLVTYSLVSRCVSQVIQLPASCCDVFQPIFLPPIHPKFSQVLAVLNSTGVLSIIDFTNATKLKTVKSHRYNIDSVSESEDGNFLAVNFRNSTTKIYPVRAFFPEDPKAISVAQLAKDEVAFRIVEKREKEYHKEEDRRQKKKEKHKELQELLDKNKWYQILQEFTGYPGKYRNLIWVSILDLPRNYSVFSSLLDKGIHVAFEGLQELLHLSDGSLLKTLQGTLSCLAHWAPFLASVEYLPEFVFPFVKVFHSNPLLCFEVTITIITHLMKLKVTAEDYAWSVLTSAFSKVLSNSDWFVLWDHILSNPPSFLPCVAAAFTLKSRKTLLTCADANEVRMYYNQESWISVKAVLDKAYMLHNSISEACLPKKRFGVFTPIPPGGLPLFNIGPRDARDEEKENIEGKLRDLNLEVQFSKQSTTGNPLPNMAHLQQQEDMVYLVGQKELQKQEEECLDSIVNLRKRHLASTLPKKS
ncbi:TBC1 domain family member 31 isoform X2 [Panulirus ornatus]|uniref:TBC1 domain family member 31 isoform X2 n=1 Tax=Panulirus ornatus TaxID=150431 RepID=UPI003A898A83